MAAFALVRATLRSDIGAKSAAERLPIFVNAFAVLHNAITIIVSAIQFRHWRHLLSLISHRTVATQMPLREKKKSKDSVTQLEL